MPGEATELMLGCEMRSGQSQATDKIHLVDGLPHWSIRLVFFHVVRHFFENATDFLLLDTLWIMGMKDEFKEAVQAVETIDFTTCALDEINVFETTIRYLGGFLAAYDLSNDVSLLRKAIEIGSLLYKAFDTPNRMPITRWKFRNAAEGTPQIASEDMLVAEIGSLTLEFTRLSQVSGDPRYYDAVQRIMDIFDAQQDLTKIPGLWPVVVNPRTMQFNINGGFTLGGMADSTFEYLPKVSRRNITIEVKPEQC
jgi:mannosyl-oligosaccharide alpha-1,2-mannosidase